MNVQQLSFAVNQRQESDRDIVVCVQVGARASIIVAIVLHGNQGRKVSTRITQGDRALPAETLLP